MLHVKTLLSALAVLAGLAVPAFADSTLDAIKAHGKLIVAVPQDFAPFGSAGPTLEPEGYDIDVAKLIASGLGVPAELVPVTSANRIPYLQSGKADLIISSLGANADRAKVISFSEAYAPFFSAVYAAPGISLNGPADLAGKTAGVTRGSVEDLEISKIAPATATIMRFEDNATTLSAYITGQVPVVITGNTAAARILKDDPSVAMTLKFKVKDSPCYIGYKKDDTVFGDKINSIIGKAKADGTLNALAVKWFEAPLGDLPGVPKF